MTNHKTRQEFKKLEQILKTHDPETGEEISINKSCAQMDLQVPMLMGVSAAILENVIFCHQDEALWPFSDQSNLKKIFDEIFETSNYTKFLEKERQNEKAFKKRCQECLQELQLFKKDFSQLQ